MLDAATLDRLTRTVSDAIEQNEPIVPALLLFLFGRFERGGDDAIGDALGRGLAVAAERPYRDAPPRERAAWARLFARAAACSDDARMREASRELAEWLQQATDPHTATDAALIEALFDCGRSLSSEPLLTRGVERLELLAGDRYRPGRGMSGGLEGQIAVASALLVAHAATGRLPYAMLADELMQAAVRTSWLEPAGTFGGADPDPPGDPFAVNCAAARVYCRLARLYADPLYRSEAVLAPGADPAARAERLLRVLDAQGREGGAAAAEYGLALADWLDRKI